MLMFGDSGFLNGWQENTRSRVEDCAPDMRFAWTYDPKAPMRTGKS